MRRAGIGRFGRGAPPGRAEGIEKLKVNPPGSKRAQNRRPAAADVSADRGGPRYTGGRPGDGVVSAMQAYLEASWRWEWFGVRVRDLSAGDPNKWGSAEKGQAGVGLGGRGERGKKQLSIGNFIQRQVSQLGRGKKTQIIGSQSISCKAICVKQAKKR